MKKRILPLLLMTAILFSMLPMAAYAATHAHVGNHPDSGCIVCKVAGMINELPEKDAITIENAAEVTEQIHAIDRVKTVLEEDQYAEMIALVQSRDNEAGSAVKEPTLYMEAIEALQELDEGGSLYVAKRFVSADGSVVDVSEAEVKLKITRTDGDNEAPLTLTMSTLGARQGSLSAVEGFYTAHDDGWAYKYILPAGTYRIEEIGDSGAAMNGAPFVTGATTYIIGNEDFTDGATVTIEDEEITQAVILNTFIPTVTISSSENGAVTADKYSAAEGTKVTLTVNPADGYKLDGLTVTKTSTEETINTTEVDDATYTFTMPYANVTVTASFVLGVAPTIIDQRDSLAFVAGSPEWAVLYVEADGDGDLSYQWYRNTRASTAGGTLVVDDAVDEWDDDHLYYFSETDAADYGTFYYYCVVTNEYGSATSQVATVTIVGQPAIKEHPQSVTYFDNVESGSINALKVVVDGVGDDSSGDADPGTVEYQWYLVNGEPDYDDGGMRVYYDDDDSDLPVGIDAQSYTPTKEEVGIYRYYCLVTNSYTEPYIEPDPDDYTTPATPSPIIATARSNIAEISFIETPEYTVTFKDHDGRELKTETVKHGKAATAPAEPTREGYGFTGWDKAFDNITANTDVTAQYALNTYTVTFKDHDGTVLKTETVKHGEAATAPAEPTREGYGFTGWDKAFDKITADTTVTAQYAIDTYTVTVTNGTGGGEYAEGATVTITANTPETGKQFKEWTDADDLNFISGDKTSATAAFTMPANAVTVTATYEDIPLVLTAPVIISPTTAQTVTVYEGETAAMSIVAKNTVSYQWYVDYNDGTGWHELGENSPDYTTSPAKMDNSGYRYKCVVASADRLTAESPIFTLEVLRKSDIPQTGDASSIGLWFVLCLVSSLGMIAIARGKKRRAE